MLLTERQTNKQTNAPNATENITSYAEEVKIALTVVCHTPCNLVGKCVHSFP